MIKILAYEDNANLRESLRLLLNTVTNFQLLEIYPHCKQVEQQVAQHQPDVILMDIDLPEIDGIQAVKKIKLAFPEIRVIMLTVFEDDEKIFDAIRAGANGYLIKKTIPNDLINAINDASVGGSPLSPGVAVKVLDAFRNKVKPLHKIDYNLSKREQEVLELLVKGYSYQKIANEIFVSIDTIRSHIKNIYIKLQVNSATEAVAKALHLKLVNLVDPT